ncbi:hypothetical protein [Sporomusa sp.]|uniref:hypothetical protein n=1 Tax=Sporomusa sp. TaxID=2078658 RepID=UPI002978BBD5|nr:hypothetical protein [Sporomusa sp.]MDF2570544.1 hypothetical protein [Sporomusa sp.]MDF2874979.1 hypothetical protein [Sporomusa sp.]
MPIMRKVIVIIMGCIILLNGALDIGYTTCLASQNRLCPEELWMELDVSAEQRKRIDEMIDYAATELLKNQPNLKNASMLDLLEFENLVNDRRNRVNEMISKILTIEQQYAFDNQLQIQEQTRDLSTMSLLSLNLTETQQPLVLYSLIGSQKQVWSIISDKKLSWEERRKKLKKVDTINKLQKLLTKDQIDKLKIWSNLLNRFKT